MVRSGYDLVVVGAGIVGLAVAREWLLRFPEDSVAVLEREAGPAQHQTGHNSGVVHGGIYYQPGSLKARLCVEGARLMYEYCEQHDIPHERCGKLIVAVSTGELSRLDDLEARGKANAVPGLRRIGAGEIAEIEPNAVGLQALHAPNTGIVDYPAVARALVGELTGLGAVVRFGAEVTGIDAGEDAVVYTADGPLRAGRVIACAGLWSDRLARRAGAPRDPQIVPFRGAYLGLKPTERPRVRRDDLPGAQPRLAVPGCAPHQAHRRRRHPGADGHDGGCP